MPREPERSISTLQIARYDHGGGRIYFEDGSFRELIADTYDEEWREYLYAAIRNKLAASAKDDGEIREPAVGDLVAWKVDNHWYCDVIPDANCLSVVTLNAKEIVIVRARAALERNTKDGK